MNFAYGGTGVFPTLAPDPNMTTQIDFFQDIIHKKIYSGSDLCSSMALVSVAGNDYSTYATTNGSPQVTFDHPYTLFSSYFCILFSNSFMHTYLFKMMMLHHVSFVFFILFGSMGSNDSNINGNSG